MCYYATGVWSLILNYFSQMKAKISAMFLSIVIVSGLVFCVHTLSVGQEGNNMLANVIGSMGSRASYNDTSLLGVATGDVFLNTAKAHRVSTSTTYMITLTERVVSFGNVSGVSLQHGAVGFLYGVNMDALNESSTTVATSTLTVYAQTIPVECGRTYVYRAMIENDAGTAYGISRGFKSPVCPMSTVVGK